MAQIIPGDLTIDPTVVDGSDLAARLERFYAAEASQNSGPSRPASLKAGGIWCKTGAVNSPALYMFDGTTDVLIVDKSGISAGVSAGATRPVGLTPNSVWVKTGGPNSPDLYLYDGSSDILIANKNGIFSNLQAITDNGSTTTNAITVAGFTSTGIDDNATGTTVTIDSSDNVTLANKLTITKSAIAGTQTVAATGSTTLDFDTYQNFVLTLTGNVTLDNPTTAAVGQSGFIVLIQDATGGHTVSLGGDYETAGGAGLNISSTASATDIVPYVVAASGRILLGTPQLAFS